MKNLKLLLATTAMLSTAVAMNVKADDPVTAANYSNHASATLTASIDIMNPISMTDGSIRFPNITTTNMNNYDSIKVKINHDGTTDFANSTAQIVDSSNNQYVYPIQITGGDIGNRYQSTFSGLEGQELADKIAAYNSSGSWSGMAYNVVVADTIPMYEVDNMNQLNDTQCGEVGELQRYWYYDTSLDSNKGGFKLYFGGTFTLKSGYTPSGRATCRGSTTVTFIMNGNAL